ncbi:MAG: class I SAM-dependent methyltransferase, partial [Zavarzinella sp.]|nr:class I SAM-dependent methyltransferase [Zavarzinella sp.]
MTPDPAADTSRQILAKITEGFDGAVAARFWDGSAWAHGPQPAPVTLVLKHPGAVRAMFWPFSKVGLGESYIFDDFDIDGDIFALTGWLRHLVRRQDRTGLGDKSRLLRGLLRLPNQKNPRDRSKAGRPTEGDHRIVKEREAVSHAYDLPADFYRQFLDRHMQYSCAYFATPDEDLDTAQEQKLDYICRKLRLRPGERLVDFGCGWGGLIVHAARNYGVEAVGVTLSKEQAKVAEGRVTAAGLAGRVRVALCDYREFADARPFDKAVSVGMAEHIGNRNLPVYMAKVAACLRPGAAYLHHSITLRPHTPYPRWTPFARKYVFPNGELQTLPHVLESAAAAGFDIRDVENLREHYAITLENWVRRLEANRAKALELVGEVTYRVYRIYMAGATMGFKSGVYS